jgi:hypothetical protein
MEKELKKYLPLFAVLIAVVLLALIFLPSSFEEETQKQNQILTEFDFEETPLHTQLNILFSLNLQELNQLEETLTAHKNQIRNQTAKELAEIHLGIIYFAKTNQQAKRINENIDIEKNACENLENHEQAHALLETAYQTIIQTNQLIKEFKQKHPQETQQTQLEEINHTLQQETINQTKQLLEQLKEACK